MNWEFEIGDKVHDRSRNQNGVITLRKYQEEITINFRAYYVCYQVEGKAEFDWQDAKWLSQGHQQIID